ncbi:hypothetical protein BN946_scf184815.g4 [Trametes cinnabarina]|uniref:Cytochrome P450 n=1 Tax=Pycnoporus cinnabarinus TaxID=5643 RepID=A0A060S1Y5_PYCCI|nr:hypothetical protein BN946_scf184815.g4 [Trametes cinnabarina]
MTSHELWRRAIQWGTQYGQCLAGAAHFGHSLTTGIYLRVLNTPFVFLNSAEAVMDLLHKRGALYSDRAHLTFGGEMCGFDDLVPLTKYGERFKLERKLMNQALGLSAVEKWQPLVERETHLLLQHLTKSPEAFAHHSKRFAASLIFSTIYGYHIAENDDPYVKDSEEFMEASAKAMTGPWVVDFFTWLRWVPGLTFHKTAAQWRAKLDDWVDKPYRMFKALPDSTAKRISFCGNLLLDDDGKFVCDAETEYRVKWLATSMYGPGSDTTVITLSMLVLSMCHYPEVLRKAQRQVDSVLGTERLPSFQDRPRLPYIDCIIKEVLRWETPVPMTPPHRLIQDDRYRGYDLPEGSFCIANMWAILHDETLYPDPLAFSPERFEKTDEADKASDP